MQEMDAGTKGLWQVTCQCGWRVRGPRDVVVASVQEHGRHTHGVELSEDQVLEQAVPAGPEAGK